ncbi:MAG: chain-length determining protein [Prevotella sp.]|jgi:uncharacterized protein involved in exopolysaccharide biosynthesis|nr:chain-length determining protein [Prevotella sp.]
MEETKNINEKEIDLLAMANKLWLRKKFILKVLGIGFIIGLIIAFSIPKEYTTTVILTPDNQSSSSGTISSLAALAGINVSSGSSKDALASPDLYPAILNSTSFLKGLLNIEVREDDTDMPLSTYIKEYQKKPWWEHVKTLPSRLLSSLSSSSNDNPKIKNDSITHSARYIPSSEMSAMSALKARFDVSYDKKTGITTVDVTMQNPEISAFIADTLTYYLQSYIIDYRTQKARMDLQYAEKLYEESKENYYKTQADLAMFIDRNMNVVSASYRTTQEKLQNEMNLSYSIYNQTAQQLQMAKIKVQNTTPVFTIIQPAVQPFNPSRPQKNIIVIGILFLSFVGATIWILRNDILDIIKVPIEN